MELLAPRIIYPISDSLLVVAKKFRMTIVKNQNSELVLTRVQNNYKNLNQATQKDHFPLSFIDQVLERLASKSHYCFLDDFSSYIQIHIALVDQHKTTFQRCMLLESCMKVFMDDFMVYKPSFDACLESLSRVLDRYIETNFVLNFEKCHFMVTEGKVLGYLVSNKGIEVDKAKIDIISSLSHPASARGSLLPWTCMFLQEVHPKFQHNSLAIFQAFTIGCGLCLRSAMH
ncbi:Retrovirus-related Pol polyprotein from transposon opus, partial [Mucuna pruriens]